MLARFLGVYLFLVLFSQAAFGWDAAAHEIIATLAEKQLNPRALQAVFELARQIPTSGQSYDAVTIACWMDDLRHDPTLPSYGLFKTWHYIDIGIDPGDPAPPFEPGNDNEYHGNAVQALKRAYAVLRGGTDPYIKTRAMALAIAMHLVGDIHQPLHAATHYFYTVGGWRHHDAGGNREYVVNAPPGDPRFSLHAFWDSAWRASFDTATGNVVLDPRYQERGDPADIAAAADAIATLPPPHANLQPDFAGWARESNRIALDYVYRKITATENREYCRLSSVYVARSNAIARQRLLLAAYRLAVLLNQTLGAATPPIPPPSYPAGPPSPSSESDY